MTDIRDLQGLLHEPSIVRIAELIRREINLWVGLLFPDGHHVWVGTDQSIDKPLCDSFMIRQDTQSCISSYADWFCELGDNPSRPVYMKCHAGLQGIAAPICINSQCIGAFFASGFVFSDEEQADSFILSRSGELNLNRNAILHGCRELVRLTRRESRIVRELLSEMTRIAVENLSLTKQSDDIAANQTPSKQTSHHFSSIIGTSEVMKSLKEQLKNISQSHCTVLLSGSPGCGKSLIAQSIHYNSERNNAPYIVQSCAIAENSLDSELFGHRRGAAANALTDKPGLFEIANKGTFFLDDIESLSDSLQVKLLQFIKTKSFLPLGDVEAHHADIRLIAATNMDLSACVSAGKFRKELYDTLNVVHIHIPDLRDHSEDIPALCQHFLSRKCAENRRKIKSLTADSLQMLIHYPWPGNIRELESEIERIVVVSANESIITPSYLAQRIQDETSSSKTSVKDASAAKKANSVFATVNSSICQLKPGQSLPEALLETEKTIIQQALALNNNNRTRTAEMLQISRRNLLRKLEQFRLQ